MMRSTIDSDARIWSRPFDLRGTSSLSHAWLEPAAQRVLTAFGGKRADGTVPSGAICVITRLRFKHVTSVVAASHKFKRLHTQARREIPGLVVAAIRCNDAHRLEFTSLWRDETSMLKFTTLDEHVKAVRWTIRHRGEVWSGVFDARGPRDIPITSDRGTSWRLAGAASYLRPEGREEA